MSQWVFEARENEGFHGGKLWLKKDDETGKTLERALFKPDTKYKESAVEYEAYKIATALGIPCAKVEIIEFEGKEGIISYDFKDRANKEIMYIPPDDLYHKSDGLTIKSHDSRGNRLDRIDMITFEMVKAYMPQIKSKVVDMLFFDCLIRNGDRHGFNWELIMSRKGEVLDVAPLFDHGKALWIDFLTKEECRLPWAVDYELRHYDMFGLLCQDYTAQMALISHTKRHIRVQVGFDVGILCFFTYLTMCIVPEIPSCVWRRKCYNRAAGENCLRNAAM